MSFYIEGTIVPAKVYINQVSERDDWQVATRKTMELLVSHASHGLVRYLVGSRASLRAPRFGGPRGPIHISYTFSARPYIICDALQYNTT